MKSGQGGSYTSQLHLGTVVQHTGNMGLWGRKARVRLELGYGRKIMMVSAQNEAYFNVGAPSTPLANSL